MRPIQKIPLEQIDLSDETFSVNFMPDLKRLRSSIEEVGLIQPVLLRERPNGYQIVCGFRRVSIFRDLGRPEIEAGILKEKERDDLNLFSISLHENLTSRGFNTVEKAIALAKLVQQFQVDPVVVTRTFLPLFSLEPHGKILGTYLSLAEMEDEVKRYVLKEEVSRFNIRILSSFGSEGRKALLPLLASLKLGENRLREMLTLLEEISLRDRIEVKDILHRPEMETLLAEKELTPSQRAERVKKFLLSLRYPRMREIEENFENRRKRLDLPSAVSIRHVPFFEGKGLRVEFQFEKMEEYRSILSSLSVLPERKEFQEMLQNP
ncbi:MAG: ParB N-terminal domain-containing protein [Syntrophaceae bacterium]|nr:ParB N-terminal domain-containing protein [Syntrophaceae bacterium]